MDRTPSDSGRNPDPDGMQEPAPRARPEAGTALPGQDVRRLLAWLVRVRWLFLLGLGAAILAGVTALHTAFPVHRVVAVGAFILAYNTGFRLYHRFRRSTPTTRELQLEAGLQNRSRPPGAHGARPPYGGGEQPLRDPLRDPRHRGEHAAPPAPGLGRRGRRRRPAPRGHGPGRGSHQPVPPHRRRRLAPRGDRHRHHDHVLDHGAACGR